MNGQRWAIGIDLGGTKIDLGLVNEEGIVHKKLRLNTDAKGGALAVKHQMIEAISSLTSSMQGNLIGIGIGVAGQIEAETGVVYFAPNLNWHQEPLQADLAAATSLPVVVTNDVRAITWGEWFYGAGRECKDFICLFIGTGIGSGIVSGGHLIQGCSNTAGEVGHMTIDRGGPLCTCGNHGCFEAYAGGWGIAEQARLLITQEPKAGVYLMQKVEGQLEALNARLIIEAAHAKDPLAEHILEEAKEALIIGSANLVNAFNPCRLILGGGILEGMPEWISAIEKGIRERALKAATRSLQVMRAQLIQDAGVIGSATLAMQELKSRG